MARAIALEAPAVAAGPTIGSYFAAFSPAPSWFALPTWPPDAFALANLVLDHSEAYRFAVDPPHGRAWPPVPDWGREVVVAADAWRAGAGSAPRTVPDLVARLWGVVTRHQDTTLAELRRGRRTELHESLLTLLATADEACRHLAQGSGEVGGSFEQRAWEMFATHGSLSRVDPARVRVTPKTHFASRGVTIRSFSRYLALSYESIDLRWHRVEPARWSMSDPGDYNLVLLPWPLVVEAGAFRAVDGPLHMDTGSFGFFEFAPAGSIDLDLVRRVVAAGRRRVDAIDAVVLPEDALQPEDVPRLEELLSSLHVPFLVTGVRRRATPGRLGGNSVHLAVRTTAGWVRVDQAKHHRWCLDESQIRQYHLSRVLDPAKVWWEAIGLPERTAQVVDIGGGATIVPLVCEDLARLDEVAEMLRRIGPTLVVTLLLDGPQLPQRWPCRYASVVTDDPGSAVLALTSLGMALRSRPAGHRRSRAVATWSEPGSPPRPIELAPRAAGILISTTVGAKTVWTADGRRHEANTPSVALRAVHQLRP